MWYYWQKYKLFLRSVIGSLIWIWIIFTPSGKDQILDALFVLTPLLTGFIYYNILYNNTKDELDKIEFELFELKEKMSRLTENDEKEAS